MGEEYDWTFFRKNLKSGDVFTVSPKESGTSVIISKYLADRLSLKVGDGFLTYFVQESVRARKFTITGDLRNQILVTTSFCNSRY